MNPRLLVEDTSYRFGLHVNKYKSYVKTFEYHYETSPLRGYQVCHSNMKFYNVSLKGKKNMEDVVQAGYNNIRRNKYCYIHAPYVFNPAGAANPNDPNLYTNMEKTRKNLINILDIAAAMRAKVVLHIGSCKDKESGIRRIAETCVHSLTQKGDFTDELSKIAGRDLIPHRFIALENSAGQGTTIGSTVEEMGSIITKIPSEYHPRVKFCIDTAHLQGVGKYNLSTEKGVKKFFDHFDDRIGLDFLECMHLNDSLIERGAKIDAHAPLGLGTMFSNGGEEGLREILYKAKELFIPTIGEPPVNLSEGRPKGMYEWEVITRLCDVDTRFQCESGCVDH